MEKFSVHEVIELAIQTERVGYQFYTEMAEKFVDNKDLVPLFKTLAAKELLHEKAYTDLKNMIGETDAEIEGYEELSQYMRAIVESEFFLGQNKSLPSLNSIQSEKDAVACALGFEKETLLFFVGLRDVVKEKEIVDEIIAEEKRHIVWLDALIRKLRASK
jgi:rubrerythrin